MSGQSWLVVIDGQRIFADPASEWGSPLWPGALEVISTLLPRFPGRTLLTRWVPPAPEKRVGSWRDYMAWRRVSIWRVIGWCMLCMFAVYLTGVVHQLLGWPESDFMAKMALVGSPVVLILTVAVAAPIFEELVFRGFMYSGFERSLGAVPAVLLTSAIFAMMHVQYNHYELLHIFVLGLVLAWARMRTQSLWTPIAMHAPR